MPVVEELILFTNLQNIFHFSFFLFLCKIAIFFFQNSFQFMINFVQFNLLMSMSQYFVFLLFTFSHLILCNVFLFVNFNNFTACYKIMTPDFCRTIFFQSKVFLTKAYSDNLLIERISAFFSRYNTIYGNYTKYKIACY